MPDSKILQNRISWYAAKSGLADGVLAARTGLTRAHLNRIKNGRVVPRVDTAIAVAQALCVRVDELYRLRRR
jgi:DNA-binding XRE family transcriptional regulator